MNKFYYYCKTCHHYFFNGKMITDGTGQKHERCPNCHSWNYILTNLSLVDEGDGVYRVEYTSPIESRTLFVSTDSKEARRVCNRMENLSWEVFQSVLAVSPIHESRLYLDNEPCLMNGFQPLEARA